VQFASDERNIAGFHGDIRAGADAMPTSACASAGASLMPSRPSPRFLPSACRFIHFVGFMFRQDFRENPVNAACRAIASAVRLLSL